MGQYIISFSNNKWESGIPDVRPGDTNWNLIDDNIKIGDTDKVQLLADILNKSYNIGEIAKTQIAEIPEAVFGKLISADFINNLSDEAIKGITAAQLNKLSPDAIKAITADQIAKIPATEPNNVFGKLNADFINNLSDEAIKAITADQIAKIPAIEQNNVFGKLNADFINNLSKDAIKAITEDQIKVIPAIGEGNVFSKLNADFMNAVDSNKAQALREQIGKSFITNGEPLKVTEADKFKIRKFFDNIAGKLGDTRFMNFHVIETETKNNKKSINDEKIKFENSQVKITLASWTKGSSTRISDFLKEHGMRGAEEPDLEKEMVITLEPQELVKLGIFPEKYRTNDAIKTYVTQNDVTQNNVQNDQLIKAISSNYDKNLRFLTEYTGANQEVLSTHLQMLNTSLDNVIKNTKSTTEKKEVKALQETIERLQLSKIIAEGDSSQIKDALTKLRETPTVAAVIKSVPLRNEAKSIGDYIDSGLGDKVKALGDLKVSLSDSQTLEVDNAKKIITNIKNVKTQADEFNKSKANEAKGFGFSGLACGAVGATMIAAGSTITGVWVIGIVVAVFGAIQLAMGFKNNPTKADNKIKEIFEQALEHLQQDITKSQALKDHAVEAAQYGVISSPDLPEQENILNKLSEMDKKIKGSQGEEKNSSIIEKSRFMLEIITDPKYRSWLSDPKNQHKDTVDALNNALNDKNHENIKTNSETLSNLIKNKAEIGVRENTFKGIKAEKVDNISDVKSTTNINDENSLKKEGITNSK